jgi:hypothetical protein
VIVCDCRSWGWWWTQNATTCWEAFPGGTDTRNHIFLCGGVGEWFWKHMVGLKPSAPAFAAVTIAPQLHYGLGPASMSGAFTSPRGVIESTWNLTDEGKTVLHSVRLPVGVEHATVVVPKPFLSSPTPPTPAKPAAEVCKEQSEKAGHLALACSEGSTIEKVRQL